VTYATWNAQCCDHRRWDKASRRPTHASNASRAFSSYCLVSSALIREQHNPYTVEVTVPRLRTAKQLSYNTYLPIQQCSE
jgi:hypothetical protein